MFRDLPAAIRVSARSLARGGVIVIGDALWRSQFAADPSVIGRAARLDGGLVVIVGVMPPRFDTDADFWTPFVPATGAARDDRQFSVFARLAPGATIEDVARELREIGDRFAADHRATNAGWEMYPVPLRRLHGGDSRPSILLLQAACFFLLLIACANIANILLARATDRRYEMAIRLSIGATRGRLVRALFLESVLLAGAATALGVALATWGLGAARTMDGIAGVVEPELNLWVLAFAAALGILTAIGCGIFPALLSSSVPPNIALASEARGVAGRPSARFRSALVVLQIGIAVVLVTCGGLLVRTLINRLEVDLGFEAFAGAPLVLSVYPPARTAASVDPASLLR